MYVDTPTLKVTSGTLTTKFFTVVLVDVPYLLRPSSLDLGCRKGVGTRSPAGCALEGPPTHDSFASCRVLTTLD